MIRNNQPGVRHLFGLLKRLITESIKQLLRCFLQECLWEFETVVGT